MATTYEDVAKLRQTELNFANVNNFYVVIERLPEIVFTCQRVDIGSLSAGEAIMPNRFNINKSVPGESLDYGQLTIDFIVTQNFSNYRSILEWLKGNQRPDGFQQGIDYINKVNQFTEKHKEFKETMSNITVIATDAADRPMCQWNFTGAFPISLQSPSFDSTNTDVQYLTSSSTFEYLYFEHQTYTNGQINNNKI